jgi:hypothetical protein
MAGPRRRQVVSQHQGVIALVPPVVRRDLLDIRTGVLSGADVPLILGRAPGRTVHISGRDQAYAVRLDDVPMTIETNADEGWVEARGQWWWCSRFQVAESSAGSLVTQTTFNVASPPASLLVPFTVARGHSRRGRLALQGLIAELGRRHGCEGHLLD